MIERAAFNEPIDLVYAWVDDSDPQWLESKRYWEKELGVGSSDFTADYRYTNIDELKYSLRSVEKFAPWFRKIHLVTAGHYPEWLDTTNEKINLVTHEDIFPDKSVLPVFNSTAIEIYLDKIPGLSEHFIYFNDDFFLGATVEKESFYTTDGMIKVFPNMIHNPPTKGSTPGNDWEEMIHVCNHMLDNRFSKEHRRLLVHHSYISKKSVLDLIRLTYEKDLREQAARKFRSNKDFVLYWHLLPYYALYLGEAVVSKIDSMHCDLRNGADITRAFFDELKRTDTPLFCLNNASTQCVESSKVALSCLNALFPLPSSFEKNN